MSNIKDQCESWENKKRKEMFAIYIKKKIVINRKSCVHAPKFQFGKIIQRVLFSYEKNKGER